MFISLLISLPERVLPGLELFWQFSIRLLLDLRFCYVLRINVFVAIDFFRSFNLIVIIVVTVVVFVVLFSFLSVLKLSLISWSYQPRRIIDALLIKFFILSD